MKGVIADIVADIAVNRSGEAVGELIKRFCECDSGTMMAGLIAAAHVPLLLPAVALVGAKLLLSKSERAEQEEFQCHCDEVCHRLKELAEDTQDTEEKLTALVEHRTWIWGRISGADQAVLAQRITNTLLKRMSELSLATDDHIKGLVVYSETVLWKVDRLQESFDSLAKAILAKYERSESDLRTIIGDREKEVAALRTALEAAQRAADAGNNDAELAIRVARATGDAELLQKTIAHIAREERQRYLQRRQQEDSVYVTRAREVVAISYLRQDFDEALLWLQEILAVSPDDLDATYRIAIIHLVRGELTTAKRESNRLLQLATDDEWRAEALLNLGMIAIKSLTQGQDADEQHKLLSHAGSFIFQSLEIFEDREIPDGLSRAATSLGDCYVALESRPDARRVYNFALQVCRELEGAEEHQADILARLALIADQAGEGRLRLTESRDLYVRIGMPHQAKRMQEWLDRLPE